MHCTPTSHGRHCFAIVQPPPWLPRLCRRCHPALRVVLLKIGFTCIPSPGWKLGAQVHSREPLTATKLEYITVYTSCRLASIAYSVLQRVSINVNLTKYGKQEHMWPLGLEGLLPRSFALHSNASAQGIIHMLYTCSTLSSTVRSIRISFTQHLPGKLNPESSRLSIGRWRAATVLPMPSSHLCTAYVCMYSQPPPGQGERDPADGKDLLAHDRIAKPRSSGPAGAN